jgi:SET domain-containing protein
VTTRSEHAPGIGFRRGRRGRGVFALRPFAEGDVVEICPTAVVDDGDVAGDARDYVFSARQPGKLLLVLGYGMLYNHSADPNLFHRSAGRLLIEFIALCDIAVGEELTHNYGPDYWDDRRKRPR